MIMLRLLLLLPFFVLGFSAFGQINDFKLPETWANDFVIALSYRSSMSGGKTEITFTFDSCTYISQSHHSKKPSSGTFKLQEADRVTILKKLKALKADQIKSEDGMHAVRDGWSQSICFGSHCIEGGTSVEMSEEDKNQFLEMYSYLEDFAMNKKKRAAKG